MSTLGNDITPGKEDIVDVYHQFALEVVRKAGILVRHAFGQQVGLVMTKSSETDFVTETDQAVEKLLISELSERFPDHKFIGEESAAEGKKYTFTDAPTWIIDPIDGTTNFVHRIPFIAICVGLTINKRLCAGIVYNPITEELFSAVEGKGALKNGFPIRASQAKVLSQAVLCQSLGQHNLKEQGAQWLDISLSNMRAGIQAGIHGGLNGQTALRTKNSTLPNVFPEFGQSLLITQIGSDRSHEQMHSFTSNFNKLMGEKSVHGHRAFGSAAINMVYVAQGAVDAYVEYGIHSWDMAAAVVIVKEAGGAVIDPTGAEFNLMSRKVLCAGTEELARQLSGVLTHVEFPLEA